MTIAISLYANFLSDVSKWRTAFTATLASHPGYFVTFDSNGKQIMPFWSTRGLAERMVVHLSLHHHRYNVASLTYIELLRYLDVIAQRKYTVGINCSGYTMRGFEVSPNDLKHALMTETGRIQKARVGR